MESYMHIYDIYKWTYHIFIRIHYSDVIMSKIAFQTNSVSIVYSTFCSGVDQRKYQSSASLAFARGIHRGPGNSPHKEPVTRKNFPFDDVIMKNIFIYSSILISRINILNHGYHDRGNAITGHKNTRSCIDNECCCLCTVDISNIDFKNQKNPCMV